MKLTSFLYVYVLGKLQFYILKAALALFVKTARDETKVIADCAAGMYDN